MRQRTLAEEGFEKYRKPTRREGFFDEMERIIPWRGLTEAIEPFYPKGESAGRPPIGLERMLRIHFLEHGFNLSDPAVEEALYGSRAMRRFVGIDLGHEPVPDETTVCKFRQLLDVYHLGDQLFVLIAKYLEDNGLRVSTGTMVDATILEAPSSTKNKDKKLDSQMHQPKKGNHRYVGMKAHIGTDSRTRLMHSVVATAAHVHDGHLLPDLLRGRETRVWGDSAYAGQKEVICRHAPTAKDATQRKSSRHRALSEAERQRDRNTARVRTKVEHPLLVLKSVFGFRKLDKNANRLFVACTPVDLFMARRILLRQI